MTLPQYFVKLSSLKNNLAKKLESSKDNSPKNVRAMTYDFRIKATDLARELFTSATIKREGFKSKVVAIQNYELKMFVKYAAQVEESKMNKPVDRYNQAHLDAYMDAKGIADGERDRLPV